MLTEGYSVKVVCEALGVTRSSYYYQPVEPPDEAKLRGAIKKTAAEWPTYGYRRITKQLQRGEWVVNHKRVRRLMRLMDIQAQISMADQGEAWHNGYAERLIRTIKEEEVDLSEYLDYHDAYQQIGRFLDDVNMHKRIHSSLGYLTPVQFATQSREEHVLALEFELRIA